MHGIKSVEQYLACRVSFDMLVRFTCTTTPFTAKDGNLSTDEQCIRASGPIGADIKLTRFAPNSLNIATSTFPLQTNATPWPVHLETYPLVVQRL